VDQDYGAYDEIDQSVWRFVLQNIYARLRYTAHPAYVKGLEQTGIAIDHIPRIEEMDDCLSRYGWGAVVVDGFIPPRAFQEFQAHGIMTIAAAIRRRRHLAYTPAPDIIHESAGHAPIVPDPDYRAYLQRFGEIGARAFSNQQDRDVYEAIRHLSEVKEDRYSTAEVIGAAERRLDLAQQAVRTLTEAALLSRLHWWTVEYGLVGRVDDYKIYGAGLLSSLGESHFCHDPTVRKVPLSVDCVETGYDITKPQPQLFVAEDFAQLNAVLDEFADRLAQRTGGLKALQVMLDSKELGTIELNSGLQISGILQTIHTEGVDPAYVQLVGECIVALRGQILPGHGRERHREGFGAPIGPLEDGAAPSTMRESDLERYRLEHPDGRLRFRYRTGIEIEGRFERSLTDERDQLRVITLSDCRVRRGDKVLFQPEWGEFDLAVGEDVVACFAGAADPVYYPATEFSHRKVPRPKDNVTAAEEGQVLHLYRQAIEAWSDPGAPSLVSSFERVYEDLRRHHPEEWLLRWNLLESLIKVDQAPELRRQIRDELLEIEKTDPHELPISTGLDYLRVL
jgi:phenylalanine-4-hydroxylase